MPVLADVINFAVDTDCLFTWDAVPDAEGYELRVGADWETGAPLVGVDVIGTSYQATEVLDNVDVFIKAKAEGYDESANAASVTTDPAPVIVDVTNVTINVSDELTWDAVPDATSYEIRYSHGYADNLGDSLLLTTVPDNTPLPVPDNAGYRFYIRAHGPCNTRSPNYSSYFSEFNTDDSCGQSNPPTDNACWTVNCLQTAGTKISEEVVYEEPIAPPQFLRVYETRKVRNPEYPSTEGSSYVERYFDSNLCGFFDAVSFHYHAIIQDITAPQNLIYAIGIRNEDPNDITATFSEFGTGLGAIDINDNGGAQDTGSILLFLRDNNVFEAFTDAVNGDSRVGINDPDSNVALLLDGQANTAQINGFDIALKTHADVPGVGKYSIERNPDGTIKEINQLILNISAIVGARTVPLPLTLPDNDETKVNVQVGGSVAAGIAAGNMVKGSLTTTTVDIIMTNGVGISNDDAYVRLTWKP